jgi:hypothetical protein
LPDSFVLADRFLRAPPFAVWHVFDFDT